VATEAFIRMAGVPGALSLACAALGAARPRPRPELLAIPTKDVLNRTRTELTAARPQVIQALRFNTVTDAGKIVDDLLLVRHLGMSRSDVAALRGARENSHRRRVARGLSPGVKRAKDVLDPFEAVLPEKPEPNPWIVDAHRRPAAFLRGR